jgi:very-short-patch-repair endonuclease
MEGEIVSDESSARAGRRAVAEQARDRVVRLVDFLKDYDAQKNPPVTDIDAYGLFSLAAEQLPDVPAVSLTGGAADWLTVSFVDLPAAPPIPVELSGYLPAHSRLSATVRPEPVIPDSEYARPETDPGEDSGESPDEDPQPTELGLRRLKLAREWVDERWLPWSGAWRAAQQAKEFYRRLFEQQQLIANDREAYELVWGFGRLAWAAEEADVNHPLFTTEVEIATDGRGSLSVRPVRPLELETLPYANIALADRAGLGTIRESVGTEPFDPWTVDVLASRCRTAVRALHHEGVLTGEGAERTGAPRADTGWVLYTRRRRPDRQGFLDGMRELYDSGALPPDALSSVVVDSPSAYAAPEAGDSSGAEAGDLREGTAELLLLPLPSNEEQRRILRLAQRQSGVIVQGPPGTGKSHTIANLVSHYVAYGHRVLVVAEKEQALGVLGEKIPPQIRELTVSVLGSDATSRRALESAIGAIQGRVSDLDRDAEDRRIRDLTADLAALDADIAETTNRMMRARRSETETLTGEWPVSPCSPERAAAWVAEHRAELGYIPDRLPAGAPLPLTPGELAELKRLLDEVGLPRARQSAYVMPELARLPRQKELDELVARQIQLRAALETAAPEIDDWSGVDEAPPGRLAQLRDRLAAEAAAIEDASEPWLAAIAGQLADPLLAQDWQGFLDGISADRQEVLRVRPRLSAHHVELPDDTGPAFVTRLEQARERLAERGRLGMFSGDVKKAVQACRVDGAVPATAEAIGLCLLAAGLRSTRRQVRTRWLNQVIPFDGPDLDSARPEDLLGALLKRVTDVLGAPRRWAELEADLRSAGITVQGPRGAGTVARLLDVVEVAGGRNQERAITARLDELGGYLRDGTTAEDASPLWQLLADALDAGTFDHWQRHRDTVADLVDIAASARRLVELGDRLHAAAPIWANAVYAATDAAGDPERSRDAWQWRRLETWVSDVMGGDSPQQLQRDLEELAVRRRNLVAELVGVQAWRRLADNLGDRQRQALNRYLAATKRFGKTGGKFAARWLAEIREALNQSKDAVPVWVMTTARALASFRPDARAPFDVVIIDEASQIGIEALPLLALAQRAIVVGDDKQTSPSSIGVDQGGVFDLIDAHLSDVPGHRVMFNPGNSLYDLARQKFPSLVMLREHFRCLPEIIAYSNTTFYADKIEPLREDRPSPGWPALGSVKVTDGYLDRRTDTNEPEANVVVDLVAKMIGDPAYDGMDFGVVCLRAGAQAQLIHRKLFDRLGPGIMTERRLRVGDAPNFQGDERDVMLVCTVVGTDPANPAARIGVMTSVDAEQRLNVAASRARNRMITVHSLDPVEFPANDLRAALIRHCQAAPETATATADALAQCDSEFERRVLRRIVARGYARVRSQVRVGTGGHSYRIDLVVDGPESCLAVECDGERWHGEDRWYADRARQEVLERAGWTFCRIRGSAFFRDPDAALEPLWERLDELRIPTGEEWLDGGAAPRRTVLELRGSDLPPTGTADGPGPGEEAPSAEPDPDGEPAAVPAAAPVAGPEPARSAGKPPEAAARASLPAYRRFTGGPFPPAAPDVRGEIASGLREIVAAEGPVLALRAYQLYVQASGGRRVGSEIKRILNKVTSDQIRAGRIAWIRDAATDLIDRTLYVPDTAPVLVRELGPRELHEVPMSEVRALAADLGLDGLRVGEEASRALIAAYGLSRLGSRAAQFLLDCQRYEFRTDVG